MRVNDVLLLIHTAAVWSSLSFRYHLQLWLEHVMSHPLFRDFPALRDFLTRKGTFLATSASQYNTSDITCVIVIVIVSGGQLVPK